MGKSTEEMTVAERIKKEKRRLKRIFVGVGKNKLALVDANIDNLAFYTVMCEDIRNRIIENGISSKYQNGANQHGEKSSPDAEVVDKWSLRIDQITGRLLAMVPEEEKTSKLAELMCR